MTFEDLKSKWSHLEIEGWVYFDIESAEDVPADLMLEFLIDRNTVLSLYA